MLTARGRTEAARVVDRLGAARVAAIYTSDLERAHETAAIVGQALGMHLQADPALRERHFGVAQGHPLTGMDPARSGIEGDRVVDADARPAEGESLRELYQRVADFITGVEMRELVGDVLVVTHGGVIRVAQAYGAGIGVEEMTWGPVPNASVWGLSRPRPSVTVVR